MTQVSTNLTLLYRIFLPVFTGVFLGAFASYALVQGLRFRYILLAVFLGAMALFALTVWRLRRVEMSRDWVYVTDFFRQARYPWTNVSRISERSLGLFRVVRVYFHEPGSFGPKATFIASGSRWRPFKEEYPDRMAELVR